MRPLFTLLVFQLLSLPVVARTLEKKFALPKKPAEGCPINVSDLQDQIYVLYWVKMNGAYQLNLTQYDRRTGILKSVELSKRDEVAGGRQSLLIATSSNRAVYLFSAPKGNGAFASILGVVDMRSLTAQSAIDLDKIGIDGPADLVDVGDDHVSVVTYSPSRAREVSLDQFRLTTLMHSEHRQLAVPDPIGTFSTARRGRMLWFTPYGLMMPNGGGRIVGVHLLQGEKPNDRAIELTVPSGNYLTGLTDFNGGLLAVLSRSDPEGTKGIALEAFDESGRIVGQAEAGPECAIGSPAVSVDGAVVVARCVRLKREPFDRYRVNVDKFVLVRFLEGRLSVADYVDSPREAVAAFSVFRDRSESLELSVVTEEGNVFLSK